MENKSGRRISLNFFDIIIIVVVIALAAGFIWIKAGRGQEGGAGGNTTVQYDIEITNLTADTQNLIAEGDAIIDKVKKQDMGKVVSFEFYPMKKDAVNLETGDTVYTEVPGCTRQRSRWKRNAAIPALLWLPAEALKSGRVRK